MLASDLPFLNYFSGCIEELSLRTPRQRLSGQHHAAAASLSRKKHLLA